ncbi:Peptidase S66, LD-carboxypeptidase A, partial [mine drainage metagenome]
MFGMAKGLDYTLDYFRRGLFSSKPFGVEPSEAWSDDSWWRDQDKRKFILNPGFDVIHGGDAVGTVLGGNLCTLNLLQGTEFMPKFNDAILFLEDDDGTRPHTFDRDLQSLIHQPDFDQVNSIVIGRFQKASGMTKGLLTKIINTKKELRRIPV